MLLTLCLPAFAALPDLMVPAGPHAAQVAQYGAVPAVARKVPSRGPLPFVTPGPDLRVYGYLAYWDNDLNSVPWDDLTDIAIFSAGANSDGSLYSTGNWDVAADAVAMGAPYGVRVELVVTDFDPNSLTTLLSSATNRNNLIDQLVVWQASTGVAGVNIDFEGLPVGVKTQFVTFITDLESAVGEVSLAGPAVDWAGAFDYSELTKHADIFIMGYGYHWGGSSYAGPQDPLYAGSGTVWSGVQSYSLSWTVDDYLANGGDPSRIIMGLPLYGMSWSVSGNAVPTGTLGSGSSVVFADAWADGATYGRSWEGDSEAPYTFDGAHQVWYGDEESVQDRIAYVRDETDLAGIGFWALHYDGDDPSFWAMIHDNTSSDTSTTSSTSSTTPSTDTTPSGSTSDPTGGGATGFVADAGQPFLAYVGDTVVLSGKGSRGPEGVTLQYRWTQISGPAVQLTSATDAEPGFRVEQPGTDTFELLVGDGTTWSAPARSYLVVIDPDLPNRHLGCGCSSSGSGAAGGWLALGLVIVRRRRPVPATTPVDGAL